MIPTSILVVDPVFRVWVGKGISEHPYGRKRGNTLQPTASAHVMGLYGNDRITC